MTGELFINSKDAYTYWGVNMGTGFVSALWTPVQLKSYITNEVREENGTRYLAQSNYWKAEREVSLQFVIVGSSTSDFITKRDAFLAEISGGAVTIAVPALSTNNVFTLWYTGKSCSLDLNTKRTAGKFTLKFTEPNPANRTTWSA